jgi:hypothetical protein
MSTWKCYISRSAYYLISPSNDLNILILDSYIFFLIENDRNYDKAKRFVELPIFVSYELFTALNMPFSHVHR